MREPISPLASAGARFRAALAAETPLQVMGTITAYAGLMAKRTGYQALYLSGGGVAANSLGMPDLGISTMEDVLTDARRIVDATGMPLLVDIDTGWGGAFNIARTIRSMEKAGAGGVAVPVGSGVVVIEVKGGSVWYGARERDASKWVSMPTG